MNYIRGTPIVIFTVSKTDVSNINNLRKTNTIITHLNQVGIDAKKVGSKYKGEVMQSIIVNAKYLNCALFIAGSYWQKHVLLVDYERTAFFVDVETHKSTRQGVFTKVTPTVALKLPSYTVDTHGQYYGILGEKDGGH